MDKLKTPISIKDSNLSANMGWALLVNTKLTNKKFNNNMREIS